MPKTFRTQPAYVAKAQSLAALAVSRPEGIIVPFASRSEATRERMRFYQARKEMLRNVPDDLSPLSTVETKLVDTLEGCELRIHAAGKYLFEGLIRDGKTGELIDTSSVREATVPTAQSALLKETEILEAIWADPKWADTTPAEKEQELARRLQANLFD